MKDQSHRQGFFGPHLLAGVIVFAAMTLMLGEISENIRNHEPMTVVDAQLTNWLHSHRSPALTQAMFVVTPDGKSAVRRNVRLGRRNSRFIEVLDGLQPGEKVVVSPYSGFLDKDRLQITG